MKPPPALRQYYIDLGLLKPDQPTVWTSRHKTLRLLPEDQRFVDEQIYEHELNAFMGRESEIPLEQVPDYVLERWERLGQ